MTRKKKNCQAQNIDMPEKRWRQGEQEGENEVVHDLKKIKSIFSLNYHELKMRKYIKVIPSIAETAYWHSSSRVLHPKILVI